MALYPCSFDGARYRGPSQAMYPAIVDGAYSEREHLRLCPPHFQQLLEYCRQHFQEVVYDMPDAQQDKMAVCSGCGGELDHAKLVFVTAYPQGEEEVQFYGSVCTRCESGVARSLLLTARNGVRRA